MKRKNVVCLVLIFLLGFLSFSYSATFLKAQETGKQGKTIAVVGSSLAAGWVTSFQKRYDFKNGYAYRLGRLMTPLGFNMVNLSVPGDTTTKVLKRIEKDLFSKKPEFAVIGLSLGNEGIEGENPQAVMEKFFNNIEKIVNLCKSKGIVPVLGSCYSCDDYDENHYNLTKEMNLKLNSIGVPMINLLGGLDDGNGHFPSGYTYDSSHPNDIGHEELFYTIVPGIFSSKKPEFTGSKILQNSKYLLIRNNTVTCAVSYIPENVFHSFSISFKAKNISNGNVVMVNTNKGNIALEINDNKLFYISSENNKIDLEEKIIGMEWDHFTISHRYLQNETLIFKGDRLLKRIAEQVIPYHFMLGEKTKNADFRDMLIFRAALNQDEVRFINRGNLFRASLEVYSPLTEKPGKNKHVKNLVKGTAHVFTLPDDVTDRISNIKRKVTGSDKNRMASLHFPEKKAVKLDPEVLKKIAGTFMVDTKDSVNIQIEGSRIFFIDRGQKTEIFAENSKKFFVKYPLAEITIAFDQIQTRKTTQLKMIINGNLVLKATKVKD